MITDILNETTPDPYEGLSVLDIKRLEYPLWAHRIVGLFMFFVGLFGFIENTLVLITFAKNKQLRSATNIFIMGVAISDFCMAVFCTPLAWINALYGSWILGEFLCICEGFLVYAFGLTALYLLTAVSIDRYIMIAKPLLGSYITKRVSVMAVLSCFAGGLFWSIFPFFGWSSYGLEPSGVFCGLHFDDDSLASQTFIITIFFFCFLFPIMTMIYCYFNVFMTVKTASRNTVWDMKSRLARKNLRIEKRMLKSCVTMCCVFWCCWFPYAFVSFWQAFGDADSIPLAVQELPSAAAKSQVVWNPIVYVATNKQFRKGFYSILPCSEIQKALIKKEEENIEKSSEQTNSEKKEGEKEGETEEQAETKTVNPLSVGPAPGEPTKVEC